MKNNQRFYSFGLLIVVLMGFHSSLATADPALYLAPQMRISQYNFADGYFPVYFNGDEKFSGWQLAGGYRFANNIVVELGTSNVETLGGDNEEYVFKTDHVALGYAFQLSQKFRLVPMIANTRWKLSARDDTLAFPNANPPNNTREYIRVRSDGSDVLYGFKAESMFTQKFGMQISLFGANTDAGKVVTVGLGLQFEF